MNKQRLFLLGLAVVIALPGLERTVSAADHINLENGYPLQVEDAYPTAYRNREFLTSVRYELTRENEDRVEIAPQLEYGLFPNTEVSLHVPFILGEASRSGSGDIEVEALYNFNTEGIYLPALALEAGATIPTGKDSDGLDTTVKFLLTKSISRMGTDRVHFNAVWLHNAAPLSHEREHRYRLIAGYSRRIAADWVILADLIRQTEREKDEDSNILELGFRWQVTPLTVVSFGGGAGVGRESPKARAIFAFQKSF